MKSNNVQIFSVLIEMGLLDLTQEDLSCRLVNEIRKLFHSVHLLLCGKSLLVIFLLRAVG